MLKTWIAVYAGSICLAAFLAALLPRGWGIAPVEALLFGSALHFGALHRHVTRADPGRSRAFAERLRAVAPGLAPRAALFLAVAAIQAYACYEWVPHADVRGGFVVATTWLVALALIDARLDAGGTSL